MLQPTTTNLKTETRTANSSYKKLAVHWLNEALCFALSSEMTDSLVLRKSPTSCSLKTSKEIPF